MNDCHESQPSDFSFQKIRDGPEDESVHYDGRIVLQRSEDAGRMSQALLSVEGLRVGFRSADGGMIEAVRGVDFSVAPGEAVGIVGESGSGKSLSMLAVMRLLGAPARATGGRVLFDGEDLLAVDEKRMRALRGRDIAMVFQDPQSSLNPALTIMANALRVGDRLLDRFGARTREVAHAAS